MSFAVTLQNLANLVRFTPSTAPNPAGRSSGEPVANRANLLQMQRQLFGVFEALVNLDTAVNGSSSLRLSLPVARSEPGLALDLNRTAARLVSTEEINATPTSFTPFGPDWDGTSTSLLTLTGVYDGSDGSGTMTFEVRRAGERGVDRPHIRIYDPQGNTVRTFTVRENHPLDREYDLRNGLSVTVGEGFLVNQDIAAFQVLDGVGSAVDPGKSFNGLRNANPNLQFGLPAIANGSFRVNGEVIAVNANDSVNTVIARINQSAAGVTAAFNAVAEQIEFVQDTPGEASTIALTNDTSNFLQATKLSSAVVTPGKDPDNERALADLAIFAGTQSGSFAINGQSIGLDVQNDSLDDVVARINSADVGAVAAFDLASGQVTLSAADNVSDLDIDSNGTGLFAAPNLPEGRANSRESGGVNPRRIKRIVDSIAAMVDGLNALFSNRGLLDGRDARVIALGNQLETAVANVLGGSAGLLDSGIGLRFNRDRSARDLGKFVLVDRRRLTMVLQKRASRVGKFLNGSDDRKGFTAAVAGTVEGAVRALSSTLGSRGSRIDTFA